MRITTEYEYASGDKAGSDIGERLSKKIPWQGKRRSSVNYGKRVQREIVLRKHQGQQN